jgi:D-3-phosphoglycerate dehydrogenase
MAQSFHAGLGDSQFSVKQEKFASPADIAAAVRDRAIQYVVVRSGAKVSGPEFERVFEESSRFVGIGRAGVGVDNIDVKAATRRGVMVQNTPEASTESVGEHAIALALGLLKRIGPNTVRTQRGEWDKKLTREIAGANVVIIGAGRIGVDVAAKFKMLGAQVHGHDPFNPSAAYLFGREARGISGRYLGEKDSLRLVREPQMPITHTPDELCALLADADVVSIHVPGEIRDPVLGGREIGALKKGAVVINTSRENAIEYRALLDVLDRKELAVGLDVLPQENAGFSIHPFVAELMRLQSQGANVIVTHHTAGNSAPAQERIGEELAGGIVELFRDGSIRNGVNIPSTLKPREGERPRVIVVNRDQRGAIAQVTSALSSHNLHTVALSPLPGPAREAGVDVLGYEVDVNGNTPASVAGNVVESLQRLYRDVPGARELLIRGYVL